MPPASPGQRSVNELVSTLNQDPAPRQTGWRQLLHLGPSKAERARAEDQKWLRAQFPRPVIIAVANPKGGAGKTPTAVGLASVYGLARGSGVVVWDNNEMRGTLGDRTFSSHRNTVVDMLDRANDLLRPDTRVADVHAMLHYQPNGQFWVLGSSQEAGQAITQRQFQTIREILSRFFSIIIVDTGNNEVAPNWVETVVNADLLVVPVKWRKDNVVPAARMIDTLTSQGRDIVNRMIIVGTNGPKELRRDVQQSVTTWFQPTPIMEIPTDTHIAEGSEMDWNLLQVTTRRAYETLGASANRILSAFFSGPPTRG